MPSWNIHTAHVERLLGEASPESLGIRDANAFLFGNLVPDVYVGYMVADVTRKIEYKDTHFANPDFIPTPDASLFYRRFVAVGQASDVTLGAWCHLLCDHYYNLRTTEYIARIGVAPGTQTRIRKQADFDLFGRTLDISRSPRLDESLVRQCAEFPHYAVDEPDVRAAVAAAAAIVRKNREQHVEDVPAYSLLTAKFFSDTYVEVDAVLLEGLRLHAAGGNPTRLGRVGA